jgi:hypothetical protein
MLVAFQGRPPNIGPLGDAESELDGKPRRACPVHTFTALRPLKMEQPFHCGPRLVTARIGHAEAAIN